MFELTDKLIVVTGASSGIGRSCAVRSALMGAKIALVGRNEKDLQDTLSMLQGSGHQIFVQDITGFAGLEDMVHRIVEQQGKISGFIHSAGIETVLPIKLTTHLHFEKSFAVNVISAFEITKHIVKKKHVHEQGASIVYISSVMGVVGQPVKTVYCASKGALIAGAKSLALELARNQIRVNCVSPGMVKTGMSESLLSKVSSDAMDEILKAHPLGIGKAEDVADACVFLMSDSARWITGTNLLVDGGYTAQ